jgi:uncharacterized repeat protein (TIGR02543 family)
VNALGHGVWYVAGNKTYYKIGNPEFTVEGGAEVTIRQLSWDQVLNAKSGKKNPLPDLYVPVYFAKSGEPEVPGNLNINPGAKFYIFGATSNNSNYGVIRVGKGSVINLDNPEDFDIRNNAVNAPAISGNSTTHEFDLNINGAIKSWRRAVTFGYYDDARHLLFYPNIHANVVIKGYTTLKNTSDNESFDLNFLMEDHGRIALRGGIPTRKYTVSFDSQGGSAVPPIENVLEGSLVEKPADPTREGFKFIGWHKDPAGTQPWNFSSDTVESDIILYASWEGIAKYTVTFDSKGGTPVSPVEVLDGSLVPKPDDPTKTAYDFTGWYKDSACTDPWDFAVDTVESDITLYAGWEKNGLHHTVTFDSNGGSPVDPATVEHGELLESPEEPIKDGFDFTGWYKDPECTDPWDFDSDTVTEDITLYAGWEIPKHTVTYDSKGGSDVPPETVQHGELATEPANPEKAGFIFTGWYKEPECQQLWDFDVDVVDSDVTLYARWEIPTHTVTFDSRGGSDVPPAEVPDGEKVPVPGKPSKEGYDFTGWYTDPEATAPWDFETNVVTEDITLYAGWVESKLTHTVTFDTQGGSKVDDVQVPDGGKVERPEDPTKVGADFIGWFKDPEATIPWVFDVDVVTEDTTIYAGWNDREHTVVFDINGGDSDPENPIAPQTVKEGSTILEPESPERKGYVFTGWYTEPEQINKWDFAYDVVTKDLVLYAGWSEAGTGLIVTFYSNGAVVGSITVDPNNLIPQPANPTRDGYSFVGWYWYGGNGYAPWNFNDTIISSKDLYAEWQ